MFSKVSLAVYTLLDRATGLPALITVGLLAGAAVGFAIGSMNVPVASVVETAARTLTPDLPIADFGRRDHWSCSPLSFVQALV